MASWGDFLALDGRAQMVRVLEVMTEVVAKVGEDYVHSDACVYAYNGKPACLVGRVLYQLGVPLELLQRMDNCNNSTFEQVAHMLGYSLKDRTVHMLQVAQSAQDDGATWGACLAHAQAAVPAFN